MLLLERLSPQVVLLWLQPHGPHTQSEAESGGVGVGVCVCVWVCITRRFVSGWLAMQQDVGKEIVIKLALATRIQKLSKKN